MNKKCCCCTSFFSCFSGNNTQSPPNNNASLTVASEQAPKQAPQAPPSPPPLPTSTPQDTASSPYAGGASSSSVPTQDHSRPDMAPASDPSSSTSTVPALTKKTSKNVEGAPPLPTSTPQDAASSPYAGGASSSSVPTQDHSRPDMAPASDPSSSISTVPASSSSVPTQDQPRPDVAPASGKPSSSNSTLSDLAQKISKDDKGENLDDLIKYIDEISEIIKSSDKKPSTSHYWPTNTFFGKLKEILSETADAASALKDFVPSKAVVQDLLKGVGQLHWIAAGFLVVANIAERLETVSANKDECRSLLEEMSNLAQHVKDLKERPALKKRMDASIKRAAEMIVEAALLCCTQINPSRISRFFSASVNKEELSKFQQKLQKMYRRMDSEKFICILDAIECMNVRPPVKERERSYPDNAVGIEEQLEEVIELLEWESDKNAVAVMVHGFGGMGKTTLADAVFARLYIENCKYSMVTLFADIQTTPSTSDIKELQKCIIKDLMFGSKEEDQKLVLEKIRRIEDGQREIGRLLEKEIAFIYIDNALGKDALEKLLPKNIEKAKKLRLLITTRDREVRKGCLMNAVEFYGMKFLPDTEAMNLLKEEMCYEKTDDKERLKSDQLLHMLKLCGGIPKLLKVLARFIRFEEGGQQKAFTILMEEMELKKKWNVEIGDIECYIFAYDRLPETVKDPFLDICSFFNGGDWDEVTNIVGEFNLDLLEKRGLVNKVRDMTVNVHDVILTIGCQKTEGTRFRFKSKSEFEEFLKKDIQGVNGISLDEIDIDSTFHISATKLDSMSDKLRIIALGNCAKVQGKCGKTFEKLIFFQGNVPHLPFNVSESKELRYLKCQPQDLNLVKEVIQMLIWYSLDRVPGRISEEEWGRQHQVSTQNSLV